MSKMGLHDPFEYLKHKLWPNEVLGIKLLIWLPTTKSQESPHCYFSYNKEIFSHVCIFLLKTWTHNPNQ
jgi:hypothetical protein